MPRFTVLVIELRFDKLRNIRVIRRPKPLQPLNRTNDRMLRHFCIHVVPLDPDPSVCRPPVDVKGVPVVGGDYNGFSAVWAPYTVSLDLCCHDFNHIIYCDYVIYYLNYKQILPLNMKYSIRVVSNNNRDSRTALIATAARSKYIFGCPDGM